MNDLTVSLSRLPATRAKRFALKRVALVASALAAVACGGARDAAGPRTVASTPPTSEVSSTAIALPRLAPAIARLGPISGLGGGVRRVNAEAPALPAQSGKRAVGGLPLGDNGAGAGLASSPGAVSRDAGAGVPRGPGRGVAAGG